MRTLSAILVVNSGRRLMLLVCLLSAGFVQVFAQAPDTSSQTSTQQTGSQAAPAAPSPLTTPSITGPLQAASPIEFDAGPLGKLDLDGIVSGMGLVQGNHTSGDEVGQAALSNGQVWIQKTSGWWQFYVQAGAYNILALGDNVSSNRQSNHRLLWSGPCRFREAGAWKEHFYSGGRTAYVDGGRVHFDFENLNIERGLLWNQENAVNRGIQLNQAVGKFTASISWNDGYYSNRYSWLSGSLTYTKGPHGLSFIGMGNLGQTARQTLATPVQNNGTMYALIYTYTKGSWIVQPYYQYGSVLDQSKHWRRARGIDQRRRRFIEPHLQARIFACRARRIYCQYRKRSSQLVNLMYGPGSSAWSITLTPTFQYQRFFTRGDLSFVRANSITPGNAFGTSGTNPSQTRGVIEVGFLF